MRRISCWCCFACQEKEADELRGKYHAMMEQTAASEREKDDELTSKNRKLNKKVDKYKHELNDAEQDISTLKTELQQSRRDKVKVLYSR